MAKPASDLVRNERSKLLANALDRASTASFAIGVLGPIVNVTYALAPAVVPVPLPTLVIGTILWITLSVGLHLLARHVLRSLR